tara:strand:- start:306 stop:797 length:492 start_codon:yes stop_codon:yes gene_type:complete
MIKVENETIDTENKVLFSCTINSALKEDLERIFFFNKNYTEYYFDIKHLIESYGQPRIVEENEKLFLNFENIGCQNLFAKIDENLVGLAIFFRDSMENIDLVHIAVDEKYSSKGFQADKLLLLQIINELKKIALKIKGIKTITVKYNQEWVINLKESIKETLN